MFVSLTIDSQATTYRMCSINIYWMTERCRQSIGYVFMPFLLQKAAFSNPCTPFPAICHLSEGVGGGGWVLMLCSRFTLAHDGKFSNSKINDLKRLSAVIPSCLNLWYSTPWAVSADLLRGGSVPGAPCSSTSFVRDAVSPLLKCVWNQ